MEFSTEIQWSDVYDTLSSSASVLKEHMFRSESLSKTQYHYMQDSLTGEKNLEH